MVPHCHTESKWLRHGLKRRSRPGDSEGRFAGAFRYDRHEVARCCDIARRINDLPPFSTHAERPRPRP